MNFEAVQRFRQGTADSITDILKVLEKAMDSLLLLVDPNSCKILEEALDSDMDFLKVLEEEEEESDTGMLETGVDFVKVLEEEEDSRAAAEERRAAFLALEAGAQRGMCALRRG